MKTITKTYQIQGVTIKIHLQEVDANNYLIPLDIPEEAFRNSPAIEESMMVSKQNFDEDMLTLMPKTLKGDYMEEVIRALQATVQSHLYRYKRILPSDLKTYVGESILIAQNIAIALNEPSMDKKLREKLFIHLFKGITNALNRK